MNYFELLEEDNKKVEERLELGTARLKILLQETIVPEAVRAYFYKTAQWLLYLVELMEENQNNVWEQYTQEAWSRQNERLYEDIAGNAYQSSYANPAYAVEQLGEVFGAPLAALYMECRNCIAYVYEGRKEDFVICLELFLEIYLLIAGKNINTIKEIKSAFYFFYGDYAAMKAKYRTGELLNGKLSFARDIIMESDLQNLDYLYRFGEYISEHEIKTAQYLNGLSQERIERMAHIFTEGFRKGFVTMHLDMSKKKIVNLRYPIGFERMVREIVKQFEEMGLQTTFQRAAAGSISKRGYHGANPNKQYDYDHRYDMAFYMDRIYLERKLAGLKQSYEIYQDLAEVLAGPALIEAFGEAPCTLETKKESFAMNEIQQKMLLSYNSSAAMLSNEYLHEDETSYTIIAYPTPEIGENFNEIFDATVEINTLDSAIYQAAQQKLIDALDAGEYVRVLGSGKNQTDITVQLHPLKDPKKETKFENCLDDVNIPLGEVFTSPVLEGTNGVLHVSEVYLNEIRYLDLRVAFEDGKVSDYSCGNYTNKEDGKRFIKENLLFQHETLPIGEFAIGTNTSAYRMAKKYNIFDKLPILIAEKTGPHFALGDTCYHMAEEVQTFNPDGKEMIAKDNSCSALRKIDCEKAYFNCHTDITIPYDELGEITVFDADGRATQLICDGCFVLPGTEELNKALQ